MASKISTSDPKDESSTILTLADKKATKMNVYVDTLSIQCRLYHIYLHRYKNLVIITNLIYKRTMDLWNAWTGEMAIQQHANDAPCPQPWLFYPGGLEVDGGITRSGEIKLVHPNWGLTIVKNLRAPPYTWTHQNPRLAHTHTTLWQTLTITQLTLLYLKIHPCLEA